MYKLVAIDIDGTLLNSKGEVTEKTKEIIKEACNRGIYIVLTSGRISSAVSSFSLEIGADKYLIAENGASIIDLNENKLIYSHYIEKATVLEILDLCIENNIYYMIYTNKELIVKDLRHMALYFYNQSYSYNPAEKMETHLAGREYVENINDDFTKIMICDEDRSIYNSIINKLRKIQNIDIVTVPHISNKILEFGTEKKEFRYSYAEISTNGTNKWSAIKFLIEKLNIKPEEVIAIGDNINDIEMIRNAGLGVAMASGTPEAKNVAKVIAKGNDEDGVAKIIEEYILN